MPKAAKKTPYPTEKVERNAQVVAAWNKDAVVAEIAEQHEISRQRVYAIVAAHYRERGPIPKGGRPRKADPDAVVEAIREGGRPTDVAGAFGITRGRVTQILKEKEPTLLQALRAEREANLSPRTLKERALRERRAAAGPIPPPPALKVKAKPVDLRRRPANWKVATVKAIKATSNYREAAAKLGISLGGLRRRVREMQGDG
jgi:DNA invertase Pin-like site-specific DNA recombinase